MGVLSSAARACRSAASVLERRSSVHPARLDDPRKMFYGVSGEDATGLELGEGEVLGWPALIQALRMISWGIGLMPCHIYERTGDGKGKLKAAEEHPLHWVLHDEPHVEYTPFEFNSAMAFRAAFQGDAYAQIMSKNGFVTSLFPMDTHRMTAKRLNGALYFEYQENGAKKLFPADQILHIKGFNDGGILGFALNQLSRTTLAKGVAMDRFGARVFKNGMTGGAVIEAEQPFKFPNDDEKKRFYDKIQESMSGQDNWHRVIGLPYGMKMKNLGVSPKDAQLIEGLTFQVQDISRLTGVPPSLLMELSRSTFTNTEQQMLQFIQLCLGPWIVNIEQRYKKSLLLSMDERKKYVIKFLVDALLRTDLKTQNDALRVAVGQPWMSVNEARDLKELQPLEGEQYNEVALPLNMASPGGDPGLTPEAPAPATQTPAQDGDADTGQRKTRDAKATVEQRASKLSAVKARVGLRDVFRPLLEDAYGRQMRAEIREVTKLVDKHLGTEGRATRDASSLGASLEKYYNNNPAYAAALEKILGPVMRSYANAVKRAVEGELGGPVPDLGDFIDNYTKGFTARQAESHLGQLLALVRDSEDPYASVNERLKEWGIGRSGGAGKTAAEKLAGREAIQWGDAVARESMRRAGVTQLVWIANGTACPICQELDGSVVGIEDGFVEASDEIDPADDEVSPLKVYSKVLHPPLHNGCECMLAAG
jgi:HK97 family phage portal protein